MDQRQQRTDHQQHVSPGRIAEGENHHRNARQRKHPDLRQRFLRVRHETPGDRQRCVADKKRGVKHHEILQLQPRQQAEQRDRRHHHEGRDRGFQQTFRQHAEQHVLALAQIHSEEPLQRHVAAVQRRQHADAEERKIRSR